MHLFTTLVSIYGLFHRLFDKKRKYNMLSVDLISVIFKNRDTKPIKKHSFFQTVIKNPEISA